MSLLIRKPRHDGPHRMSRTRIYRVWFTMRSRCYDPASAAYRHYGARGIKVCDRWRDSFLDFLADMGQPAPGQSLDRIDNDGDYSPENCRWATGTEQARNRRDNTRLTAFGETKCLADWAEDPRCRASKGTLSMRIQMGWDHHRAITTPVGNKVLAFGEAKTLHRWARDPRAKAKYETIRFRVLTMGWDAERAITSPPMSHSECATLQNELRRSVGARVTRQQQQQQRTA